MLIPITTLVLMVTYSLLLLLEYKKTALVLGGFCVLFLAEHVCNFIERTNVKVVKKLSGTIIQRTVSLLIPGLMLFSLYYMFGI